MQYRTMRNGDKLSVLGFGCMRFPLLEDGSVNEIEAAKMVRYSIDNGLNYIDTAYPYHNQKSEPIVGRILLDGYREKVKLATKLPSWLIKSREDMDKYLDEQLKLLQTDHIDYYLVHALNQGFWDNLKKHNLFDFLDKALESGKVKNIGFSFHDGLGLFKEIVDSYNWSFCQIQYNILDEDFQAGKKGLEYADQKGIDIIIMEPLRGGSLANNIPEDIMQIWDKSAEKKTPAEWALRWIWDNPAVKVVLSGMSKMDQVIEDMEIADKSLPNSLSEDELNLIDEVKNIYKSRMKVPCTGCRYCMPCPNKVHIAACFSIYNNASMFQDVNKAKKAYLQFVGEDQKAEKCIECGICEEKCPQKIKIIESLKEVVKIFS